MEIKHRGFANGMRTLGLFIVLWSVLMSVGWLIGGSRYIWLFGAIGAIGTVVSFWNSDKLAIKAMRAYPVTPEQAPEMYRIVNELSQKAGQPMPRLYISPTAAPNAFATGRNPKHAAVCCTEGILRLLDERELRGVLGHELMHVYNRDILISGVASAVAAVISGVAQFFYFPFGMRSRENQSPLGGLGMLLAAILAPLATTLVNLAISRTREYEADASGAALTGDPLALASALRKLELGVQQNPLPPEPALQNASHMMIAQPFAAKDVLGSLMSTHPPMADRIRKLEQMAQTARDTHTWH